MAESTNTDTLHCMAALDRLQQIQSFVRAGALRMGVPAKLQSKLALVLEELAVNIMHYAYPDEQGQLEVHWTCEEQGGVSRFCITLRDWGRPFNPLKGEVPDTDLALEDRPVGGLGIFLAMKMTDHIYYERDGVCNVLTFCFELPGK